MVFFADVNNGYVLSKKDEQALDGPYKIMDRTNADSMILENIGQRFTLTLRGCKGLGGAFENRVKHSYIKDLGVYLLKDSIVSLSTNQIKAMVYRPANPVYTGGLNGFSNLTFIMPQLMHIAYGELGVDHSDTNYPLYKVFLEAENIAKKQYKGYWATHTDPPAEK